MTPARNTDDALTGDSRVAAMVDAGARIDSAMRPSQSWEDAW